MRVAERWDRRASASLPGFRLPVEGRAKLVVPLGVRKVDAGRFRELDKLTLERVADAFGPEFLATPTAVAVAVRRSRLADNFMNCIAEIVRIAAGKRRLPVPTF